MDKPILTIKKKDVFSYFNKRNENSNKGSFGRSLLICGSYSMAGAAIICGKSNVTSGVGICDIACQKSIYPIVTSAIPEAVCTPLSEEFNTLDRAELKKAISKANCVVIGCGLGTGDYTNKILNYVIECCRVPLIIDADGINTLSENINLLREAKCEVILTPHPGEMSRLIGDSIANIQNNRVQTATSFANKYNCFTVLKGHETVIVTPQGEVSINPTGNAGMATGGTGDMLCGIMASFISQGMKIENAIKAAVFIHGLSGDLSAKEFSMRSTTPSTMIKMLPKIFIDIDASTNL